MIAPSGSLPVGGKPGGPIGVGVPVGDDIGVPVGDDVGVPVGDDVGVPVGDDVGVPVGDDVGVPVGVDPVHEDWITVSVFNVTAPV